VRKDSLQFCDGAVELPEQALCRGTGAGHPEQYALKALGFASVMLI
jgi:hypothetical protein